MKIEGDALARIAPGSSCSLGLTPVPHHLLVELRGQHDRDCDECGGVVLADDEIAERVRAEQVVHAPLVTRVGRVAVGDRVPLEVGVQHIVRVVHKPRAGDPADGPVNLPVRHDGLDRPVSGVAEVHRDPHVPVVHVGDVDHGVRDTGVEAAIGDVVLDRDLAVEVVVAVVVGPVVRDDADQSGESCEQHCRPGQKCGPTVKTVVGHVNPSLV